MCTLCPPRGARGCRTCQRAEREPRLAPGAARASQTRPCAVSRALSGALFPAPTTASSLVALIHPFIHSFIRFCGCRGLHSDQCPGRGRSDPGAQGGLPGRRVRVATVWGLPGLLSAPGNHGDPSPAPPTRPPCTGGYTASNAPLPDRTSLPPPAAVPRSWGSPRPLCAVQVDTQVQQGPPPGAGHVVPRARPRGQGPGSQLGGFLGERSPRATRSPEVVAG